MKYIALLRGINASGQGKVSMSDLKACFEAQGFKNVSTKFNSGNLLFESDEKNMAKLAETCESAIARQFGFPVLSAVFSTKDFIATIEQAPAWWADNTPDSRHDVLFVIPPAKPSEVIKAIGPINEADEKLAGYGSVIFWSARMAAYGRSQVVKMFNTPAYEHITLRSSTTTKKLYKAAKEF
jgi:uncharacterized protein (DUF1697 family)